MSTTSTRLAIGDELEKVLSYLLSDEGPFKEDAKAPELPTERRKICLCVNSVNDSYERLLAQGVCDAAEAHGFLLRVHAGETLHRSMAAIRDRLEWEPIDGVILPTAALAIEDSEVISLRNELRKLRPNIEFVSVGQEIPGFPSILIEDTEQTCGLVRHFHKQHNKTRIGFIGGPSRNPQAAARKAGYFKYIEEEAEGQLIPLCKDGNFMMESGEKLARELLHDELQLEAIVCANDAMALGALRVLEGLGKEREVLVSGFDDGTYAAGGSFPTVDQAPDEQGYLAVELLAKSFNGEQVPDRAIVETRIAIPRLCDCALPQTSLAEDLESLADILTRLRRMVHDENFGRLLVRGYLAAVNSGNSAELLPYLVQITRNAHREELRRWRRVLSDLIHLIGRPDATFENTTTALRVLGEASDFLALTDQRAWLDFELRQARLGSIGTELQAASTEVELWNLTIEHFSRLVDRFYVCESTLSSDGSRRIIAGYRASTAGKEAGRVPPDSTTDSCLPHRSGVHRLALGNLDAGYVVFDMDERSNWSLQQELVTKLEWGVAAERRKRLDPTDWNVPQQTRLGVVARFIQELLHCDIVIIYPLFGTSIPVTKIGPAMAGKLREPHRMLNEVKHGDVVSHLLDGKESVYVSNTSSEHSYKSWFKEGGFQEREGVQALSGHILKWNDDVVGVMFCNYRRKADVDSTMELSERAAMHAALALHQERSAAQAATPSQPPPASVTS